MSLELPEELLPQSVRDLVEVIGLTAALALVEERGGTWLRVPKRTNEDHWLADIIGLPALQSLVRIYNGEAVNIPRCVEALRSLRERQIVAELDSGVLCREVAVKYGYTEDGLRKLRRRVIGEIQLQSSQGDMFAPRTVSE